ncbi:MAG: aspartate aminotransferase family protein [Clostridia bacterium]|nr:aspartate aminotransferase family protein [Clostridia bacterium]
MELQDIVALDQKYYMNTFGSRTPLMFEKGQGLGLTDCSGEVYQDFFAGIAVTNLGHHHPVFTADIKVQVEKVLHTSSLYYIENQAKLAQLLVEHSCADRAFFCSTGAEANEGAIKLAKIYFYKQGKPQKHEIITLKQSFHGRTLATVAATGQEKYQKPYQPLTPGFHHVPINDIEALEQAAGEQTAAIMLELVQGESGVHPVTKEYLQAVKQIADRYGALLIVDEVQTGMGRTGKLFAYEHYDVEPDIFTLAKALGNGVPIGALCAKQKVADAFAPGDHGTTFGGNPLATAAGCSVMKILQQEHLVENAAAMGAYFMGKLQQLQQNCADIVEVRGMGLMIGVELQDGQGTKVQQTLLDAHYLTGCVAGKTLRILPPLIITKEDIDTFMDTLTDILTK